MNSEDDTLENLFEELDPACETICFANIDVDVSIQTGVQVVFHFTYNYLDDDPLVFKSKLVIEHIQLKLDIEAYRVLFSIGMCVLPWIWMGFATRRIVISRAVAQLAELSDDMLVYWREVYAHILAEFVYVNRLEFDEVDLQFEPYVKGTEERDIIVAGSLSPQVLDFSVLVPLGGGKDSLVVWRNAQPLGRTLLVYVGDGLEEYGRSPHLERIVAQTGCPKLVVAHDFVCQAFQRRARYFERCGHPWAALVLFDCLLVALSRQQQQQQQQPQGQGQQPSRPLEICLGYEKSADEGNGVFVGQGPRRREVNHQYDKSSAFVRLSGSYVHTHISQCVRAHSPLSDLYELEIMRQFCRDEGLRGFHPLFLSCNALPVPPAAPSWCLRCDKCAFIVLLLSAFLLPREVRQLFPAAQERLLGSYNCSRSSSGGSHRNRGTGDTSDTSDSGGNSGRMDLFQRLVGGLSAPSSGTAALAAASVPPKPFDCVGTKDEGRLAALLWGRRALAQQREGAAAEEGMCPVLDGLLRGMGIGSIAEFWEAQGWGVTGGQAGEQRERDWLEWGEEAWLKQQLRAGENSSP